MELKTQWAAMLRWPHLSLLSRFFIAQSIRLQTYKRPFVSVSLPHPFYPDILYFWHLYLNSHSFTGCPVTVASLTEVSTPLVLCAVISTAGSRTMESSGDKEWASTKLCQPIRPVVDAYS